MTQQQIDEAVNQVVNNFTNHSIAMPNGQYQGECTAPITWYLQYLGLPWNLTMQNNRADGWGVVPPHELTPYFSFESFQKGKAYPRGTILMWDSPHIAIVLADNGGDNAVVCFEQNADPDGSPCGTHTRTLNTSSHTCTFAMTPILEVANPQPVCIYTPEVAGRVMQTNKQPTNWWNLNIFSNDINQFQVAATLDQGVSFSIGGYAVNKYFPMYRYAMSPDDYARAVSGDYATNNGINVLDLEEIPVPEPIVVPEVTPAPPAGALPFPSDRTPYTVVVPLQGYQTATNAGNHAGLAVPVEPGDYYVFRTYPSKDYLKNITLVPGQPGWWINAEDNIVAPEPVIEPLPSQYIGPREDSSPPPAPAPTPEPPAPEVYKPSEVPIGNSSDTKWKGTYKSFNEDGSPDTYELLTDYTMKEYGGTRKSIALSRGRHINVAGTFTKNGVKFYRPRDYHNDVTFAWLYGIPIFDDEGNPIMKKIVEEITPQRLLDLFRLWRDDFRNYLGHKKVWDVVFKNNKENK